MDPAAPGRLRGFRTPGADPIVPEAPSEGPSPARSPASPAPPAVRVTSLRWLLAAAGLVLVAISIIATLAFRLGTNTATSPGQGVATPAASPTTATALPVTDLYQQVAPSIVLITTSKGSLGSGVIVNDTGIVLTAHHVVAGGGAISIVFADGTKTAAKIDAASPQIDIATVAPAKLPEVVVPATLGGGITVGSDVVAIGNPLGLRSSTSTGIVSGLNRTTRTKTGRLSGLVQFDAAVNPGSSGGPLLNAQGLVVGVVVSIADPGEDDAFAGIGFAVPIGTALAGGAGEGPGGGPQL
jgi:putative serine protease PepD